MTPIQNAWDQLSNAMRMHAEASLGFKALFEQDAHEAITNLDRSFEAKLEGFHRFYDVCRGEGALDFFAHADTLLLVHLRNALHHRDHLLFKSWNAMLHADGGLERKAGAAYLLASYKTETAMTGHYYLPLHDFYARLSHHAIKYPESVRALWDKDLGFALIAQEGKRERYPDKQVYVDVMPVFIAAMRRIALWMTEKNLSAHDPDGKVFLEHFGQVPAPKLAKPVFNTVRIPLMRPNLGAPLKSA